LLRLVIGGDRRKLALRSGNLTADGVGNPLNAWIDGRGPWAKRVPFSGRPVAFVSLSPFGDASF